jgi:hypothetical protein
VAVTWAVEVDTDTDGTFATDVAGDTRSASWQLGMRPYASIARASRASLVLDNSSGKYGPEHGSALAGFLPGKAFRIKSTHTNEAGPLLGQVGIGDNKTCALLDGSTTFVNVYSSALASVFNGPHGTVSIWVKYSADIWANGNQQYLFTFYVDAGNQIKAYKSSTANSIIFRYTAGGTTKIQSVSSLSSTNFMNVVITHSDADNDDEAKWYIDGAQVGTTQTGLGSWTGALATNAVVIGAGNTSPVFVGEGYFAHTAVWKTVLSGAEILALSKATATQSAQIAATQASDLLAHWPLDESSAPSGQYAYDSTVNDYDGTYSTATRTRTHGYWWIRDIKPMGGTKGRRQTQIRGEGFLGRASKVPIDVPIQLDKTADQIIDACLAAGGLYPPGFSGYWLLGLPSQSELGESTRLGSTSVYSTLDTGISTFPYAMDNNEEGSSLYAALRLVAESEMGRVFIDRDGTIVFWNRHHLTKTTELYESFSDSMFDLKYAYGDGIVNDVTIEHSPRNLDTTGTPTLATVDKAIKVKAGETKTVSLRYEDGSNNRISTTDPVTPVATTDYTAHVADDGTGTDLTGSFTISPTYAAQSVKWAVENGSASDGYLDAGSKQRGNNKLTDFGRVKIQKEDQTSIGDYGRRAKRIRAKLLEDSTFAEGAAQWILALRKDARGDAQAIQHTPLRSETLITAGLGRQIGERINIGETQTGLSADFFIVNEHHFLRSGGKDYKVSWGLEPASAALFWRLGHSGYSELGETTTLAY